MPIDLTKVPFIPYDPAWSEHDSRLSRQKETPRASYAFHVYAALGATRTIAAAHQALVDEGRIGEKSLSQTNRWSRIYAWQDRAKEYDAALIFTEREALEQKRQERLRSRADRAQEGWDEALDVLIDRLQKVKSGEAKMPAFEAVAAFARNMADIEHRERESLRGEQKAQEQHQITIQIDTWHEPERAETLKLGPGTITVTEDAVDAEYSEEEPCQDAPAPSPPDPDP